MKDAHLRKMCHRKWKKVEFIMVHSLLSSFLLYLFYCSSRSFCVVSRAELSEIVFLSELLVFYFGFLGSGL